MYMFGQNATLAEISEQSAKTQFVGNIFRLECPRQLVAITCDQVTSAPGLLPVQWRGYAVAPGRKLLGVTRGVRVMGDKVDRSYISFQVDRLEAEFERAREEADAEAFRNLTEELSRRKQTARVSRLRELLAEESRASEVDPRQRKASDGPATCPTPTVAIGSSPGSTEQTPSGRSTDRRITRSGPRRSGGIPPSFTPTPEQEQAVEAFTTRESLKINAYAGSGKTSTLQLLAHSTPRKGQYLAFNKKIVFDSRGKFPSDVDCATTHAMARNEVSLALRTTTAAVELGSHLDRKCHMVDVASL